MAKNFLASVFGKLKGEIKMSDMYLNCIKEYVRVSELCQEYNEENGTNIKPWELVSYNRILNKFSNHPPFLMSQDLSKYEFAIDILEGRPVFHGDALYFTNGCRFTWGSIGTEFSAEEYFRYKRKGLFWEVDIDIPLSMKKSELKYVVEMLGRGTEHYRLWERLGQILNNH